MSVSEQKPKTLMELVQDMTLDYGVARLAEVLNKGANTLYQEVNPHPGEGRTHKLGLLDFRTITNTTRSYLALRRLALDCDHVATPIPQRQPDSVKSWFERVGKLSKEFGDFAEEVGRALADGKLDRREALRMLKELDDLLEACVGSRMELLRFLENS